jgi:hypothetical protein
MFQIVYSSYDGIVSASDCIPFQTYSERLQYLGQSTIHSLNISLCLWYGVFAFPYWLNPERWVQGSPNAMKNCFLSKD